MILRLIRLRLTTIFGSSGFFVECVDKGGKHIQPDDAARQKLRQKQRLTPGAAAKIGDFLKAIQRLQKAERFFDRFRAPGPLTLQIYMRFQQ